MHFRKILSYYEEACMLLPAPSVWEKLYVSFLAVPKRSVALMLGLLTISTLLTCEKKEPITVEDLNIAKKKYSLMLSFGYVSPQYEKRTKDAPVFYPYSNIFTDKGVLNEYIQDSFISVGAPKVAVAHIVERITKRSAEDLAYLLLLLDERYAAIIDNDILHGIENAQRHLIDQNIPIAFKDNWYKASSKESDLDWEYRAKAAAELLDRLVMDIHDPQVRHLVLFYYYAMNHRFENWVYGRKDNTPSRNFNNNYNHNYFKELPGIDVSYVKDFNGQVFFPDQVSVLISTPNNMSMQDLIYGGSLIDVFDTSWDRMYAIATAHARDLEKALVIIIDSPEMKRAFNDQYKNGTYDPHADELSFHEFIYFNRLRAWDIAEDLILFYEFTQDKKGLQWLCERILNGLPLERTESLQQRGLLSSSTALLRFVRLEKKADFAWRERLMKMKNEEEDKELRDSFARKSLIKTLKRITAVLGVAGILTSFHFWRRSKRYKKQIETLFNSLKDVLDHEQHLSDELARQRAQHADDIKNLSEAEAEARDKLIAEYETFLTRTQETEKDLKEEIAALRASYGDVDPVLYPNKDHPEETLEVIATMVEGAKHVFMTDAHVWTRRQGDLLVSFANILFSKGISHVTYILSSPSVSGALEELAFQENCKKLATIPGVTVKFVVKRAKKLHPRALETEKGFLLMDRSISQMWKVRDEEIYDAERIVVPLHKIRARETKLKDMPKHVYVRDVYDLAVDYLS